MTHENAGIQIKDVSKKLGRKPILNGINLYVQPGETVGIIGTNGSGKSTLLRIIAGLMYPDQGQVTINGEQIKPGFVGNIPSSIGVLIEHPAFLPQFSGLQNLLMLAEIRNIIEKQDVIDILRKVGLDP
ncbi:MAG: ATP-binding cassette domain-containing protein, partial [Tumebacillaceae bacterium]